MSAETKTAELQELVFDSFVEFGAEAEKISPDASLEEIGIDSLDLVELGQIIQDRYGITLVAEEFKGLVTVRDALAVIERRLP